MIAKERFSGPFAPRAIRMPADWEPHAACLMAWAVHSADWDVPLTELKGELSAAIKTIARYEPVRLLAPRGPGFREAQDTFAACGRVEVIEAPVDDI